MTARDPIPRLLTAAAAARYLGMSETTLRTKAIPRRIIGARPVYDRLDLDRYADDLPYEGQPQEDRDDHADSVRWG